MNPTLSGDTGPYPDYYISKVVRLYETGESNTKKGRIVFTLPVGTYRLRVILSLNTECGYTNDQRIICFYRVDVSGTVGTPVVVGPSGFTGGNNTQFNAEIEFSVSSLVQGNVSFLFYNTASSYNKPGFNLLELTKLS